MGVLPGVGARPVAEGLIRTVALVPAAPEARVFRSRWNRDVGALHTGCVGRAGLLVIGMLLVAVLSGSSPITATHTPSCAAGTSTGSIDGRRYLVYVPESAQFPAPAVVGFHGRLQTAASQVTGTGLKAVADREGFIIVAPQALGGKWDFRGSDTTFTTNILDRLTCDDSSRTYASGMSMGSAMAFLQACVQPRRFAAFGGVGFEVFLPNCPDEEPAAIIAFHGTADQIVPFTGGLTASSATAPPAEAAMRGWARRDRCREYVRSVVAPGVTLRKWDDCSDRTSVHFYRIRGGKHVWPRRGAVDASALMWEFFSKYRLE